MPVFELPKEHIFPPPELAEENGLLAVGGDLSESRLLTAYSMGIFPWYSGDDPPLWWSPDPRLVLFPDELRISRSLRQVINKGIFKITFDQAFEEVIQNCADVRRDNDEGTWITDDMKRAYTGLHKSGHAHSVESWFNSQLVGGLYGISMGSAFFGESMFSIKSNASKVAFAALVRHLKQCQHSIIDCQVTTSHLKSLGAKDIPRKKFLKILDSAIKERQRWINKT